MTDWTEKAEFPGDLRNDTFQGAWDQWDDKTKLNKRAVELNNGRAAMMGILGKSRAHLMSVYHMSMS